MNSYNGFKPDELIITTGGGKVQSAGFTIFNRFLTNKIHPMYTINNKTQLSSKPIDKVSSLFDGFVVPIGLHLSHHDAKEEENVCDNSSYENAEVIGEDIYDALLHLSGQQKELEKKPTKHKNKNTNKKDIAQKKNKTKKNKKEDNIKKS